MRVLFLFLIATVLAKDKNLYERAYKSAERSQARLPASYDEQPSDPKLVTSYGNPIDRNVRNVRKGNPIDRSYGNPIDRNVRNVRKGNPIDRSYGNPIDRNVRNSALEKKMVRADENVKTAKTYVSELKSSDASVSQVAKAKAEVARKESELASAAYNVVRAESSNEKVVEEAKVAEVSKQAAYAREAIRESEVSAVENQDAYSIPIGNSKRLARLERQRRNREERAARKAKKLEERIERVRARGSATSYQKESEKEREMANAASSDAYARMEAEKMAVGASYGAATAGQKESEKEHEMSTAASSDAYAREEAEKVAEGASYSAATAGQKESEKEHEMSTAASSDAYAREEAEEKAEEDLSGNSYKAPRSSYKQAPVDYKSANSKCARQGGSCLNIRTDETCTGGSFTRFLCPGPSHIQCCQPTREKVKPVSSLKSYGVVPMSSYEAPAPSSSYDSAPVASSYDSAPVASSYDSAPVSSSYDSAPVASSYDSAPVSSSYDSAPVSSSYETPSVEEDESASDYSAAACRRVCYYRKYAGAPRRRIPCAEVGRKYKGDKKCKRNGQMVDCRSLRCRN